MADSETLQPLRAWLAPRVVDEWDDGTLLGRAAREHKARLIDVVEAFWTLPAAPPEAPAGRARHWLAISDSAGSFPYAEHLDVKPDADAPALPIADGVAIAGATVPRLGLGCMRLVSSAFEHDERWLDALAVPLSPEENRHALHHAIEACGVRYVDVARGYGPWPGAGEAFLYDWLGPFRDELVASTKVGYGRAVDGSWLVSLDPTRIAEDARRSVAEWGGRVPLLYLVLRSTPEVPVSERPADLRRSLAPLLKLVDEGAVGHVGLANATAAEIELLSADADIAAVQNNFSLSAFGEPEKRAAFELCRDRALPFVMWGIFGQDPYPKPPPDPQLVHDAELLGASVGELTVALLMASAPNVIVMPGASRRETIYASVRGAALDVPAEMAARYRGDRG